MFRDAVRVVGGSLFTIRYTAFALVVMLPCLATARTDTPPAPEAGGYSVGPSKPRQETIVSDRKRSPVHTQDRLFGGTRFWLLDPGSFMVEAWWNHKFKRTGESQGLLQFEVEFGIAPHLQLDIYQNFTVGDSGFGVEGNQIELRYAFGSAYNDIALNPVLYLEWHPRKNAQDRAEVRLLLGGDLGSRLTAAANVFFEMNIDDFNREYAEGFDMEAGATLAASYSIVEGVFRLGAEAKLGADQHGESTFAPMALLGPNVMLRIPALNLRLTGTAFIGLMPKDPRVQLLVIAAWRL